MNIWAAIKKAINSNLNKPLDDLIKDTVSGTLFPKTPISGSNGTIFSITNKNGGLVKSLVFPALQGAKDTILQYNYVIEVDGVEIFRVHKTHPKSTTSSYYPTVGPIITRPEYLKKIYNEDYYADLSLPINNYNVNNNYIKIHKQYFPSDMSDITQSSSNLYYPEVYLIDNPIRFKNTFSLKIENEMGTGVNTNGYINYELFE